MYTAFFGFKENPFNLTPDPRYLFLSRYHREALEHLLYGINERKGFIAITGGIGTGKTTLCRALLDHLDRNIKSALIFSSFISDEEILKTINHEFGIEMNSGASSKKAYIDALNAFLLENFSKGGNALLLIDEAQNLSHPVLEQIRMLSNLETEKEKLLQVVLVGQSELKGFLERPSLRQLNERITVRYNLKPLDETDLRGYVQHRLTVAGGKGDVGFSNSALKAVYAYSRGNPRRINAVCDRALLIAFTAEKRQVSRRMIRDAIKDLTGRSASPGGAKRPFRWVGWATAVLLVMIFAAGLHVWISGGASKGIFSRITGQEAPAPPPAATAEASAPENPADDLFLNGDTSLTGLFRLFEKVSVDSPDPDNGTYLGLVSFNLSAEYFVKLKRPFRVVAVGFPSALGSGPRYLLITRTTYEAAVVLDNEGRSHVMDRSFILRHWGETVSFVYPQRDAFKTLVGGMKGRGVLKIQRTLMQMGYMVEPTGRYDRQTSQAVTRFQEEFGLNPDGIVGPRTMALLFQMTDPDDEHHS
ncbi:MAG: AAA family ATPase [Deltaproteobacteria bacterium]|nr:AAA family ATPase [Deltaproteobacteria bacterium]